MKSWHKMISSQSLTRWPHMEGYKKGKFYTWGITGVTRPPGALWCGLPLATPRGCVGGAHPLWCPTLAPIFTRDDETPKQKSFCEFSSRSRRLPRFFFGRANLEAALASGEGKSSPSSSPSPLHHLSMASPFKCE